MKLIGAIPIKNEADKWLDSCLAWASNYLDQIIVLDDQSDDDSVAIAETHTPYVWSRPDFEPSFLEHEGNFRQLLWDCVRDSAEPEDGDWIFAFDADEFLVGGFDDTIRSRLTLLAETAEELGATSVKLNIPEVWELGQPPKYRTDGYWNTTGVRFVKWNPDLKFKNAKMGCGSVPEQPTPPLAASSVNLLHLGYSNQEDRQRHYDRYSSIKRHGHNPKHIASILQKPTLSEYHGPMPKLWRGTK